MVSSWHLACTKLFGLWIEEKEKVRLKEGTYSPKLKTNKITMLLFLETVGSKLQTAIIYLKGARRLVEVTLVTELQQILSFWLLHQLFIMFGPLSNIKTPSSGGQRLSSIYHSTISNLKEYLTMSQSQFTFDPTDNEMVHNKASSINSFAYPVALFVQRLCC